MVEENTQLRDENAALKEEVEGLIIELRQMGEQRYEDLGRLPDYHDTSGDEGQEQEQDLESESEHEHHEHQVFHTGVNTGREVLQSKRSSRENSLVNQSNRMGVQTQIGSGISKFKRNSGGSGMYASLKTEVEKKNNKMKKQIKTFAELKCNTNHQDDDEEFKNIEK